MTSIVEKIGSGRVLISDGAWGTALQQRGLKAGACPELWNIEHRDSVLAVARAYVEAGSDLIQANSFGASRLKLAHFGLAPRAAEINRAAAEISREAAGAERNVIASVGPTGKILIMGDVSESQLYDAFAEQMIALESGGADACCIETFAALDEACLAIRAARENTRLEIICTFTFEQTRRGDYRTMMGVSPTDMTATVVAAGAKIVGSNCGNGMERMEHIAAEIRAAHADIPILIHANAGMPVRVDGVDTFPETPAMMAEKTLTVIEAGANIVGGCCGSTPAHIRAIRQALDAAQA